MTDQNKEHPAQPGQTTATGSAIVDNVLHPLALQVRNLLTREGRIATGEMLVDDEENILQCIRAGCGVRTVFYSDDCELPQSLKAAIPRQTQLAVVARRTAKKLFGNERLSRIFAVAAMPDRVWLAQLIERRGDVLVLDNLKISGNIGAIIRTAFAFGAGAMVALDTEPADIYDRRTIRSSRGYLFRVPVVCASTGDFVEFARRHEQHVVATSAGSAKSIDEVAADPRRIFFILGAEKEGCSEVLQQCASEAVRIPMQADAESLNVSVAAGIILYTRSRGKPGAT